MKRGSRLDVPCRIYRGGTSRGLYFLDRDLPPSRDVRERILLCAMGSPDARQIDGLGGANSQTSKAMIVGPPDDSETNADVAMLFAQVGIERPLVDWGGNCGNLTSAVGVFAIDAGLVEAEEPETIVRIHSRNTGLRVHAHIPVRDGGLVRDGDYEIPGVPGSAARIDLEWLDPGGSSGRGLLPTGEPSEEIVLPSGRAVEVSIVDAANPVVFCDAAAVGLEGCELPPAIEANEEATSSLETIRKEAGKRTGLTPSPGVPKVALVARPARYETSRGVSEAEETHDLHARMMSMKTAHRSYAVTGAICTAVAASLPGTLVARAARLEEEGTVRIAHPYGVMDVGVSMDFSGPSPRVASARVGRTARLLMSGVVHLSGIALD